MNDLDANWTPLDPMFRPCSAGKRPLWDLDDWMEMVEGARKAKDLGMVGAVGIEPTTSPV